MREAFQVRHGPLQREKGQREGDDLDHYNHHACPKTNQTQWRFKLFSISYFLLDLRTCFYSAFVKISWSLSLSAMARELLTTVSYFLCNSVIRSNLPFSLESWRRCSLFIMSSDCFWNHLPFTHCIISSTSVHLIRFSCLSVIRWRPGCWVYCWLVSFYTASLTIRRSGNNQTRRLILTKTYRSILTLHRSLMNIHQRRHRHHLHHLHRHRTLPRQ